MNIDTVLFDVVANETYEGYFTKGRKYHVYHVVFSKDYPEGLFLIHGDNGQYKILTSDFFEPVND